jgi:autotransporter-associated beta strand protein
MGTGPINRLRDTRGCGRRRTGAGVAISGARLRAAVLALACVLAVLALLGAAGVAQALSETPTPTATWTGAGADSKWSTGANWGGTAPSSGNNLVFPSAPTSFTSVNDFNGYTFGNIALTVTSPNAYTFTGSNAINLSGGMSVTSSGYQYIPFGIHLTASQTFTAVSALSTVYFNGELSGAASSNLTFSGTGIVHVNHDNSNLAGAVTLGGGRVDIYHAKALGTGAITVNNGAALRFQSAISPANDITVNGTGVSAAGSLTTMVGGVSSCTGTVTLATDSTISAAAGGSLEIPKLAGAAALGKRGDGTLILSGTPTYTGALVNVYAGSLEVDCLLPPASQTNVWGGATLMGTGTAGSVAVLNTGTVHAGAAFPGTLTTPAFAVVLPGAIFGARLNGTVAGTSYDQIVATGGVTLGGTLVPTLGYTPAMGDRYTIINKTSVGAVSGTFKDLPEGSYLTVDGRTFKITYVGGDGNDVVLTRANVPTTFQISAGDNQSAAVGTAFATALKVRLLDQNSDPLPDASVTFTAPGSGASGTFAGSSVVTTDANGYATAPAFTANTTAGSYQVTASTATLADLSFNLANTANTGEAPAITSATAATFPEGAASAFTVTTTGSPKPAVTETGALPGGVTFVDKGDGTATISGTPASGTAGDYPITITATNGVGTPATQAFVLHVSAVVPPDVPPLTTVHGLRSGWVRRSVRLTFTAEPGPGGLPVDYTEYRVGSGKWTQGTSVTISRQGATKVSYRSVSTGGDVEATQVCTVRIDSDDPVVSNYGYVSCRLGGSASFTYSVADSAPTVRAKLVITRYGRHVRTIDLGKVSTGKRLVAVVNCGLPVGSWNWRVVAHDPAGARGAGHRRVLQVNPR